MFAVRCDELNREVLVHITDVFGVENAESGMLVQYRCWCGETGLLVTGKHVEVERSGHLSSLAAF